MLLEKILTTLILYERLIHYEFEKFYDSVYSIIYQFRIVIIHFHVFYYYSSIDQPQGGWGESITKLKKPIKKDDFNERPL